MINDTTMRTKYRATIAFALLFFSSCAWETAETGASGTPETRGLMQVEISENDAQGTDKISTVRFIVFSDLASTPKADINEFYDEDSFDAGSFSGDKTASKVKITLEVPKKPDGPNEKLVVAIVNEPEDMHTALEGITSPAQLENLELDMATILNSGYQSLKTDVMMPMSGAAWVSRYYRTEAEAELEQNIVRLGVSRVLARVDVYLLNGGASEAIPVAAGSTVKLFNTYGKSWFIRNGDASNTLGRIQTVTSGFEDSTWTSAAAISVPTPDADPETDDAVLACSFYTPERTCTADADADKLRLEVRALIGNEGAKSGGIVLDKALDRNGVEQPITAVRRNNVYRVTVTLGVSGITGIVQDWNIENITQEF